MDPSCCLAPPSLHVLIPRLPGDAPGTALCPTFLLTKPEDKLTASLKEAEGRKQLPVDSAREKKHTHTHINQPQNPTTFNYHLHATPTGTSRRGSACMSLSEVLISSGHRLHLCCVWVALIRLVVTETCPVLSVARRERSHEENLPESFGFLRKSRSASSCPAQELPTSTAAVAHRQPYF